MKRKLALILSAVMASSCMSVTGFAANFKDINDVPWDGAKSVINSVADKGLLSGYEDNTFRARNNVTYAETMQMVFTVMEKTGTAKELLATDQFKYISVMDSYNIPNWAQRAVAYGLQYNILTVADLAQFTVNGKQNAASREQVAKIFGQALAQIYTLDSTAPDAKKFGDYHRFTDATIAQIDLLARLGILSGDNNGNFLPANNINRAEMAVMLNKSFEVLSKGEAYTGKITSFSADGDFYDIKVTMDDGNKEAFSAKADYVKVYEGDGNKEIALGRLGVGDKVRLTFEGNSISEIRLLSGGTTAQAKYDITGYADSFKDGKLTYENENTGETEKISTDTSSSDCVYYLDNKKVNRTEAEKAINDLSSGYAYVGIMVGTKTVKDSNSNRVDENYMVELHIELTDEYTRTGEVDTLSDDQLVFKVSDGGAKVSLDLASSCDYFIGEEKATLKEMQDMLDIGSVYVKVTVDEKTEAIKIIFAEDDFAKLGAADSTTTYTVNDLSDSGISLNNGGNKVNYTFGSTNPLGNITFYQWDDGDEDWESVRVSSAERYVDDSTATVYCRLTKNAGGKITEVHLSKRKNAWIISGEDVDSTTRKGTIEALSSDTFKFKTSSTTYKLLAQYNGTIGDKGTGAVTGEVPNLPGNISAEVKNPLWIKGVPTSSLTVFKRLMDSDDVSLYAELIANSSNEVQKIEARLTAAEGTLVSYDKGDRELVLNIGKDKEVKLQTISRPALNTDDIELEDLETYGYVGSKLELGFNGDGVVNKITLTDSSYNSGVKTVKGIAESAKNGLQLEGSSKTYGWQTTDRTNVSNNSMPQTSVEKIREAIDDKDVTVYVSAGLSDSSKVESITVTVKDAEGKFQSYDEGSDVVRIKTAGGKNFSFFASSKVSFDISGSTKNNVNTTAVGETVTLTFNSDGVVTKVES